MDVFSFQFLSALISIIIIDLVLAGDNAIVIGLAARNVPKEMQKRVIIWGTVGAIVVRALATLAVAWLLKLPGLLLIGGILLVWIAYKLLVGEKKHEMEAKSGVLAAIGTILVADVVMSLDNVLAVAGAAHGNFLLIIIGLLVSIPIIVWGSTLFIKLMDRFKWIIYIGSGILAYTAAKMIVDEKFIHPFFAANPALKWVFIVVVVIAVLGLGVMKNRSRLAAKGAA
ncbi:MULTISPECIES: TerC family protein [unclassified Paenibacillus]|uniref:TerC family protein n=1 Tax=unclassified Paenibacillus TaxID=185978 RepID=UPI001C0F6FC0|nr:MULTISPECIES: TerC family protein [unclassified Paenibacillus]MBU5442705.1 TerC family protein [Paenibacillus sp. MSJ-34]CAH0120976.1 hypothetical protein PAE9249_03501 [Paenibacillus sp. CECT 9249]